MISKTIHAVWYGSPLPPEIAARIEAWSKVLPDYQIKIWGEKESPGHLSYLRNAIQGKHWANASNFMRLWVLCREGGIYLDTDVDLVRSFNPLLQEDAFVGFQSPPGPGEFMVNNAVLGANPGHPFVEDCLGMLLSEFDGTERADLSSPALTTRVVLKHGGRSYGDQHLYNGRLKILDREAFYPYSYMDDPKNGDSMVTAKTYAVHRWHISWKPPELGKWERRAVRVLSGASVRLDRLLEAYGETRPRLQLFKEAVWNQFIHKKLWHERRVLSGLFVGTRFASMENTGSSLGPKLLGTYEFAVQQVIASWVVRDYRTIYNVGCECGIVLLGLATLFPRAELIGYDINAQACSSARHNLEAWGDRAKIFNREFHWNEMENTGGRSFMLCDIEGGEGKLFKSHAGVLPDDIIIELHQFIDPSLPDSLVDLLKATHEVRLIHETPMPLSALRKVEGFSLSELARFSDEHRPIHMCWLVAEKRQR